MEYVDFQKEHAEMPMLNIGVGGNPGEFSGPDIFHIDLDRWNYRNCIQGDAIALPFRNDSFRSVVCGDVLEHMEDPLTALCEMHRVAPKIVLTTFQEWRLPGVGQFKEEGNKILARVDAAYIPYRENGTFLDAYPDSRVSHVPHINQWSREWLLELFTAARLIVESFKIIVSGIHEGNPLVNYLYLLRRA